MTLIGAAGLRILSYSSTFNANKLPGRGSFFNFSMFIRLDGLPFGVVAPAIPCQQRINPETEERFRWQTFGAGNRLHIGDQV